MHEFGRTKETLFLLLAYFVVADKVLCFLILLVMNCIEDLGLLSDFLPLLREGAVWQGARHTEL